MIAISGLTKDDEGGRVIYRDSTGKTEEGRIKSWNDKWIFVVYNCDDNWNNYASYTAAATNPEDLEWRDI